MKFGAVITAAGMSTRMKAFKQMIKIDGMTFAERVVGTFQKAGINDIVMVTGFRGQELEEGLKGQGITFIRNEDYERTEMFDSVCMGLTRLRESCDRIFFCPVDVPLFSADTVLLEKENAGKGDVIIPIYREITGHPVLLSKKAVEYSLGYNGGDGMRGAYMSFEASGSGKLLYLPVDDIGSSMDADTKEELDDLVRIYEANKQPVKKT